MLAEPRCHLETTQARLRQAVAAENYEEAAVLLTQFSGALAAFRDGFTAEDAALCVEALELLEQMRRQVLGGRAQASARLDRLNQSSAYTHPGAAGRGTWQVAL